MVFAAFGHCLCRIAGVYNYSLIVKIFIGQISVCVFLYFRVALTHVLGFGFSGLELYLFLAIILFLNRKHEYISPLQLSPQIVILLIVSFLVAFSELPRQLTMSTDSDLHVFWAYMLATSGSLGEGTYPAGFAVLNAIWSYASFMDLTQVVSMQPTLQGFLALVLIASTAVAAIYKTSNKTLLFAVQFFAIMIYVTILPYSYKSFDLYNTARLSALFILSGMILCCLAGVTARRGQVAKYPLLLGSISAVLLVGIAPVYALYALPCWLLCLVCLIIKSRRMSLLALLLSTFIVFDPYYYNFSVERANHIDVNINNSPNRVSIIDSSINGALLAVENPLRYFASSWKKYFTIDFIASDNFHNLFLLCCIILLASRFMSRRSWKIDLAFYGLALLVMLCLSFLVIPGFQPLGSSEYSYRLLPSYSISILQQIIYLLFAFQIILIVAEISSKFRAPTIIIPIITLLAIMNYFKSDISNVAYFQRHKETGPLGFANNNDFIVMNKIKSYTKHYVNSKNEKEELPKILVPHKLQNQGEKWIIPFGASRVLYMYSLFPLAFYYTQGGAEFQYRDYAQRICNNFDSGWLKARNVHYLFLPSHLGPVCLKDIKEVQRRSELLFAEGDAKFYRLY